MKGFLERRIAHAEKRANEIRERHGDKPSSTHNYHGGKSLGYYEGLADAYSNIHSYVEEQEATNIIFLPALMEEHE